MWFKYGPMSKLSMLLHNMIAMKPKLRIKETSLYIFKVLSNIKSINTAHDNKCELYSRTSDKEPSFNKVCKDT